MAITCADELSAPLPIAPTCNGLADAVASLEALAQPEPVHCLRPAGAVIAVPPPGSPSGAPAFPLLPLLRARSASWEAPRVLRQRIFARRVALRLRNRRCSIRPAMVASYESLHSNGDAVGVLVR